MANKKKNIVEKIYDYSLEEILGDRFGRYSKYIIQDRALPDVRDGLKPVQRRILYSMYKDKNTYDKPTRKSAKSVGQIMGQYHPHGDSSIYDAMVRLSQKWKMRDPLIDMQGNNGSIDGDPPAAMRYTEARLSKLSNVLLEDIEKECVLFAPTFDDEGLEPTVLPAHFPNLLVNGSTGISAGYATNIPTHNLGEVIDATIKRIDSPNSRLETILDIIKGPDFPTGGVVEGKEGLINAYTTGKGKVVLKCKYEIVEEKGKKSIIIHEIPYDTLKIDIIRKIEEIRIDKKIDGISEVRDETDKNETLRIAIDLKANANAELIINYLLKNTDLQINYNFNMVAIDNRRPKLLGILDMLDSFISHKKNVVLLRSKFDLKHKELRQHIVSGFIKAIDILDEVIKTIRKSKNKTDAKENLMKEYDFTEVQAEAIVMMQLYKLTNTDVTLLKNEYDELIKEIEFLKGIINDEEKLKNLVKEELRNVKKEYATPRRTEIKDSVTEIVIDELAMVDKSDFIVSISKSGYIKKTSIKAYNANNELDYGVKDGDYIEGLYKVNNLGTILLFTDAGNYLYLPVREISETKFKDIGIHISTLIKVNDGEKIVKSIAVEKFDDRFVTLFTKNGMVKRVSLKSFVVTRYTKPITSIKLKDNDEVVSVSFDQGNNTLIATKNGYVCYFNTDEIPVIGLKASGVKGIKLVTDEVVSGLVFADEEYLTIFTKQGTAKRIKVSELIKTSRAKKGSLIIKSPKSKKYEIFKVFVSSSKTIFGLLNEDVLLIKASEISIMDKVSVGSNTYKGSLLDIFKSKKLLVVSEVTDKESKVEVNAEQKEEIKEQVIEELTMSDFFDEFKI